MVKFESIILGFSYSATNTNRIIKSDAGTFIVILMLKLEKCVINIKYFSCFKLNINDEYKLLIIFTGDRKRQLEEDKCKYL